MAVYFTDRGTVQLDERRGEEQVALHRGPRILIIGGGYGGLHTAPRLERLLRPGERPCWSVGVGISRPRWTSSPTGRLARRRFRVGEKEELSTMLTTSEQQELRQIQQVLRKADRGLACRLTVLQGALRLAAPVRQVYLLVVAAVAVWLRRLVTVAGRLLRAYVKGAVLMDPVALMALADAAWPGWGFGQAPGPSAAQAPDRPQSDGTDLR